MQNDKKITNDTLHICGTESNFFLPISCLSQGGNKHSLQASFCQEGELCQP